MTTFSGFTKRSSEEKPTLIEGSGDEDATTSGDQKESFDKALKTSRQLERSPLIPFSANEEGTAPKLSLSDLTNPLSSKEIDLGAPPDLPMHDSSRRRPASHNTALKQTEPESGYFRFPKADSPPPRSGRLVRAKSHSRVNKQEEDSERGPSAPIVRVTSYQRMSFERVMSPADLKTWSVQFFQGKKLRTPISEGLAKFRTERRLEGIGSQSPPNRMKLSRRRSQSAHQFHPQTEGVRSPQKMKSAHGSTKSLTRNPCSFSEMHKLLRSTQSKSEAQNLSKEIPVSLATFNNRADNVDQEINILRCQLLELRRDFEEKQKENQRTTLTLSKYAAIGSGVYLLFLRGLALTRGVYKRAQSDENTLSLTLIVHLLRNRRTKDLLLFLWTEFRYYLSLVGLGLSPDLFSLLCLSRKSELAKLGGFLVTVFRVNIPELYKRKRIKANLVNLAANVVFILIRYWMELQGLPSYRPAG